MPDNKKEWHTIEFTATIIVPTEVPHTQNQAIRAGIAEARRRLTEGGKWARIKDARYIAKHKKD